MYQFNFGFAIRFSVWVEYFVEPDSRFIHDVRVPPRIPRVISLRLSRDEAPIDRPDLILLREGQHRVKGAACAARHVLGTEHRAVQPLQEQNFVLEAFWPSIVVKGDHIGVLQLDLLGLRGWRAGREIDVPNAAGKGM